MWDMRIAITKKTSSIQTWPNEPQNPLCHMIPNAIVVDCLQFSNLGCFAGYDVCKLDAKPQSESKLMWATMGGILIATDSTGH